MKQHMAEESRNLKAILESEPSSPLHAGRYRAQEMRAAAPDSESAAE